MVGCSCSLGSGRPVVDMNLRGTSWTSAGRACSIVRKYFRRYASIDSDGPPEHQAHAFPWWGGAVRRRRNA